MSRVKCEQLLKDYWGYSSFRLQQWEVIEHVLSKQDGMVLFPTGGGKSLCYQIPGLFKDGVCLVISPLISLMKDQTDELQSRGISANYLTSDTHLNDRIKIWSQAQKGQLKFLFLSPEAMGNPHNLNELKQVYLNLIAIDEAHCISEWGHDFRPSYLNLPQAFNFLSPAIPKLALTATATPKVLHEICSRLELRSPQVFQSSFKRENLAYFVIKNPNSFPIVEKIIKKNGGSGIIYASSRKKCEDTVKWLSNKRLSSKAYHAGLSPDLRVDIQNQWKSGKLPIVVATNAFGMGINKEDVRWVIHLEPPKNCESYFQEAGRAGRDGKKAFSILFASDERAKWLTDQEKNLLTQDSLQQFLEAFYRHFRIALHEGENKKYQLNFDEFYKKRKISPYQVKRSLLHLKNHEFLTYHTFGEYELYFQFINVHFNPDVFDDQQDLLFDLYEFLIRKYADRHFEYIPVDKNYLAQRLGTFPDKIERLFEQLKTLRLVRIQHKNDCIVQLLYNREKRLTPYLGLNKLEKVNHHKIEQAYSLQQYIQNNEICRTAWMMNYFNENSDYNCGICDICIEQKKDSGNRDRIKKAIDFYLQDPIDLNDLLGEFKPVEHGWIKQYLNELSLNEHIEIRNQYIYPKK